MAGKWWKGMPTEANHMCSILGLARRGGLYMKMSIRFARDSRLDVAVLSIDLICYETLSKNIITLEAKWTSSLSRFLMMSSKCSFT